MRKWKPNSSQKNKYKEQCTFRDSLPLISAQGPIRTGCKVKYYSIAKDQIIEGVVIKHSYGSEKGQHTFTIQHEFGKVLVKGRNLYPNLLAHTPSRS